MRDQYAGDISDLLKFSFLRELATDNRTVGVAWYYNPEHDGRPDGRHREYCYERKWEPLDAAVWNALRNLPEQSVAALERLPIWPTNTCFHRTPVPPRGSRQAWSDDMRRSLEHTSIIFLDPDNGVGGETERHSTVAEVAAMRQPGRAVVLIRFPGRKQKHAQQLEEYHNFLRDRAGAVSVFTVCTCVWLQQPRVRWFTIVDGDATLIARAKHFAEILNRIEKCSAEVVGGALELPEPVRLRSATKGQSGTTGKCSPLASSYTASQMTVRPQDANAYILRLGDSGPAGLSQAEALDRLFSSARRGAEMWFAINISNPGQLRAVSLRLIDQGWRFCASWNGAVRFVARVRNVVATDDPQPVPSICAQADWVKEGRAARSRCWVQLDPDSFRQVHWARGDILTWQDSAWRTGFPKNQTSLLRGIIPP